MNGEAAQHLGNIYARALFDLAKESRILDGVRNDLLMLRELASTNMEFTQLNESPYFMPEFKSRILRKVLAGRVSDLTMDFLMIAAKRNRLGVLDEITTAYEMLWDDHNGIVPVSVMLASAIEQAEVEKLKADIGMAIQKSVKLEVGVNPGILGGIVIRCGDSVIDNSVRGLLARAVKTIIDRNGKA